MRIKGVCCGLLAAICIIGVAGLAHAGDQLHRAGAYPPLDPTLMGFKDQGVWYFLCAAPIHIERIPPHYLTYGPPPVPYCPPPAPCPPQVPVKQGPQKIR